MKTITLDESAYKLLKAWKKGTRESFSSVVNRVVPIPGTLGAFAGFVETKETGNLSGNEVLESTVNERSASKHDAWT